MAEDTTGFDLYAYRNELDETGKMVMPDYWEGHARMELFERLPDDFSEKEKEFAYKLLKRMHEKYPTKHSAVAKKVINVTTDKLR